MKLALLSVLLLGAICLARGQFRQGETIAYKFQRLLAGVFGARGGGRYGNPSGSYGYMAPNAGYPNRGQGFAPGQFPSQMSYGAGGFYGRPGGGFFGRPASMQTPFYGTSGGLFRRVKRQIVSDDLLIRGFRHVRRLDADTCILRAACEAAADEGVFGDDGDLAIQFVLSLRYDNDAPWHPYLLSARVGQNFRSHETCRRIFQACARSRIDVGEVARKRLLEVLRCIQGTC
ncbi:unnamed protein product [Ixodes pacificus]